jgi:hypothetical protein
MAMSSMKAITMPIVIRQPAVTAGEIKNPGPPWCGRPGGGRRDR